MRKRTLALAVAGVLCAGGFGTVACGSSEGASDSASTAAKAAPGKDTAQENTRSGGETSTDGSDSKSDESDKSAKKEKREKRRERRGRMRDQRVLHGEQEVRNRESGHVITAVEQNGKVTSASATSLKVRSSDGVTWTWKLGDDAHIITRSTVHAKATDLKTGDQVMVIGQRSGDTRTVHTVSDPPRSIGEDAREWLANFKATHDGQNPGEWYDYGWNWDRPQPDSSAGADS